MRMETKATLRPIMTYALETRVETSRILVHILDRLVDFYNAERQNSSPFPVFLTCVLSTYHQSKKLKQNIGCFHQSSSFCKLLSCFLLRHSHPTCGDLQQCQLHPVVCLIKSRVRFRSGHLLSRLYLSAD